MNCPICQTSLNELNTCPQCSWKLSDSKWVLLGTFELPSQLVIESLLQSYGIPMKAVNQEVAQFPFSIGPLAETLIFVPEFCFAEAQELLKGQGGLLTPPEEPE